MAAHTSAHQSTYSEPVPGHALTGTQRHPPATVRLGRKTRAAESNSEAPDVVCAKTQVKRGGGEGRIGEPGGPFLQEAGLE